MSQPEQGVAAELVEFIARGLVDQPDYVEVREIQGEQALVLELEVARDDIGQVIGKHGRTVRSMRTLLSAVSSQPGQRVVLEILD